jgi:hypothetical protein
MCCWLLLAMPIEKHVRRCEFWGFFGPSNCWLPIVGSTLSNCYKFNIRQFAFCYLNYDRVGCLLVLHTMSNWNCNWSLYYIMDTCKVNLSPFWVSWLILDYCNLSRIIVTCHWRDIRQKLVFAMFENVYKFFHIFKMFPTTIWVKAYLGGTTRNHPPQNRKNVDFILINERTNFKKQLPMFL